MRRLSLLCLWYGVTFRLMRYAGHKVSSVSVAKANPSLYQVSSEIYRVLSEKESLNMAASAY
jgi:hypothetical protein